VGGTAPAYADSVIDQSPAGHSMGTQTSATRWCVVMLALLTTAIAGCSSMSKSLQTVPHVDLPRYMGDWYVIANIPYFAEKNCVDSIESYALRSDGDIDNWFTCRKKTFDAPLERKANALAKVENKKSNAEWSVRFFKVISVKYLVLDLDPQYQWVAVGHPSRRYGWVMSRSKTLDEQTYQAILKRLTEQGYDVSKFQKVPQNAANPTTSSQAANKH
jgi:apolipoprotein D and lipocalin family protein